MANGPKTPVDIRHHELSWLFTDALGLFHLGRKYASMLLLLCAVDAFAKRADPKNEKVGDRFHSFLKEKLPPHTRIRNFYIKVHKRQEILRLECILYKYLRNPMVHEGASLELDEPPDLAVCIDWSAGAPSVKVDPDRKQVILGGDWVLDVLFGVVRDALLAELTPPST